MSPSRASREISFRGTVLQGPLKPWGSWSTISCHGEPKHLLAEFQLCSLSSELSPAVVLEAAPPWLQPVVRGQQGPSSCQLALPWPCSVAWSTWAPCVLPVNGMCCPQLLHSPSWGWGSLGGIWWLHMETLCAAILIWDCGDLLLCSPQTPTCAPVQLYLA